MQNFILISYVDSTKYGCCVSSTLYTESCILLALLRMYVYFCASSPPADDGDLQTLHPPLPRDEHSDLRIRPPIHALGSIITLPTTIPLLFPLPPLLRIFSTHVFGTKMLYSRHNYEITTDV
jgi:hypothetical protein